MRGFGPVAHPFSIDMVSLTGNAHGMRKLTYSTAVRVKTADRVCCALP
jgi:hypothetical protein